MKIFIISICNKKDILVDKFIDKYRKQINSTFKLSFIDIGFNSKKNTNQKYFRQSLPLRLRIKRQQK